VLQQHQVMPYLAVLQLLVQLAWKVLLQLVCILGEACHSTSRISCCTRSQHLLSISPRLDNLVSHGSSNLSNNLNTRLCCLL
jgi:hypothetical protein